MGRETCWDLPPHQFTSIPHHSPCLSLPQMSNATHAWPSPAAPSSPGPGTAARLASATPSPALTLLTAAHNNSQDGQQLFLTTTTARVISGIFVWSALIVTFHQVWAGWGHSSGLVLGQSRCFPPSHCKSLPPGGCFLLQLVEGKSPYREGGLYPVAAGGGRGTRQHSAGAYPAPHSCAFGHAALQHPISRHIL